MVLMAPLLIGASAFASPTTTQAALDRVEEVLELRLQDGQLRREDLLPAMVVSTRPRYQETAEWYATEALSTLADVFGEGSLRLCEACMAPRTTADDAALVFQTGPVALEEVVRLDDGHRGDSAAARSAIWLDETQDGVSVRIVDLRSSGVVFARNIDPTLEEYRGSRRSYALSDELERRALGKGLTHTFIDLAGYPKPHVALEWTDQWGKTNANLSGVSISALGPILGVGIVHYRALPLGNILIGGKLLVSVPNTITRRFDVDAEDFGAEELDPLFTGVGVVRVPFGRSNYAALATVSTTGAIGLGITLLNFNVMPVNL